MSGGKEFHSCYSQVGALAGASVSRFSFPVSRCPFARWISSPVAGRPVRVGAARRVILPIAHCQPGVGTTADRVLATGCPARPGDSCSLPSPAMNRLTSYSHGAGCACKLGPGELAQVLRRLRDQPATRHPYLLVGIDGSDDAGVFRLSDDLALVQTVDFFTPIVDEADDWGRIAAVNALSDVYAMGGTPLTALLIVGWPRETLSFDLLGDVLAGAAEILAGAGVTIVGGHSVDDPEPKFGLAVTGTIHPDRVLRNQGARPGDLLVLTKPIGTGVIATGIKRGVVSQEIRDAAVISMTALNDTAGRVAVEAGAAAATDVTGFGLLGHLGEMLGAVGAEVDAASVPLLAGARELASDGVIPGGSRRNLEHASGFTEFGDLDATTRILLADAQTSGGLLVAIDEDRIGVLLSGLTRGAVFPAVIGRFTEEHAGRVMVT